MGVAPLPAAVIVVVVAVVAPVLAAVVVVVVVVVIAVVNVHAVPFGGVPEVPLAVPIPTVTLE